jgi:threonine synthase
MKFHNINDHNHTVSLKEAVLRSAKGLGDLYMPEFIPELPPSFFHNLHAMELNEIAGRVTEAMLGDDLTGEVIESIVSDAFTFDIPLKQLDEGLYVLELFHGPTLAFKDVGARFMAGLFGYLVKDENNEITILAATSGDTGSAVASAFYNKQGIRVVILYPSGKVSDIQEKQLTTMGGNITALEISGTFDDCQKLVKMAFADKELNDRLALTSANSINFARLFPQSFYYFFASGQLGKYENPLVFSVPSGNFGNLTAGLIAKRMGLPVHKFIAATNINRSVPEYLSGGIYSPQPTRQTITNAMDVGNPSNFPRILDLYDKNLDALRSDLEGKWFTDSTTIEAMKELYSRYHYSADPHGAVGYLGLKEHRKGEECTGIFLETAHPVKFSDVIKESVGKDIEIPAEISEILKKEKQALSMPNSFMDFKDFLSQL